MRTLVITNYYPPSDHGWGYMQLCEDVADGLVATGHDITVLTSTYCDGPESDRSYTVHRLLTIDPDWHSDQSATLRRFASPTGRRWFLTRNRFALRGTLTALAVLPGTLARRRQMQRGRRAPDSLSLELRRP